jgi:hypothetical protein
MTILHVFKSQPDDTTNTLVDIISGNSGKKAFMLYEDEPDYEKLIDQIFESDKVICWW